MSLSTARGLRPGYVLLVVLIGGVALLAWLLWPQQENPAGPDGSPTAETASPEQAQQALRERFEQARAVSQQEDPAQRVRETIAVQLAAVEADPESPDAPGLLNAMGNLHMQRLMDYRSAAEAYQRLLLEYPQWEGNYHVFPQLEVCYEQLRDDEGLRWLWAQMMERFPPESDLHKYGAQQLGIRPAPPSAAEEVEDTLPEETVAESPEGAEVLTPPAE